MGKFNRYHNLHSVVAAALFASICIDSLPASGSVLDCQPSVNYDVGYEQFAWVGMTADLNTANGGSLPIVSDLSNLQTLMSYTGLWVDVRILNSTLSASETSNLQTFIASGRRVVLIGGAGSLPNSPGQSAWDNSILTAAGGPSGVTYFSSNSTPSYAISPVTTSVSTIAVQAGAVSPSGTTLFADKVATVWGSARNALVVLTCTTMGDDSLASASDTTFASNLAAWVTGGETDGPCPWNNSAGGSWQDSSQWQLSEQPSVADDAVFNLRSAGYVVTVPGPQTARNLMIENDHITVDLSSAASNLVLSQGIAVGQNASTAGSLTFTHSVGGSPATISAASISLGNGASGVLTISTGIQLNLTGATHVAAGSSLFVNGGTLTTSNFAAAGTVSITDGTINIANAATHGTLNTMNALTLTGSGSLNLANTDLDLPTGNLATITAEIQTGYANGNWTGTGINSSAAAGDQTHLTALGVILNNDGAGHPVYGSSASLGLFDGTSPGLNDLLIRYTYCGDANLDGRVDGSDYSMIDNGCDDHLTGWANGDFNYDGIVNGSDYTLIDNAFNSQGGNLTSTALIANDTAEIAANLVVPEPACLGMLAIGVMSLRRRRRR